MTLEQAAAHAPVDAAVHYDLGVVYALQGRIDPRPASHSSNKAVDLASLTAGPGRQGTDAARSTALRLAANW